MAFRSYQPSSWPGERWNDLIGRDENDVWEDRYDPYGGRDGQPNYFNRNGRRCRIVCDPLPDRNRYDLRNIARRILGIHLISAKSIYPNIRAVIVDGQKLIVTQDYDQNRINVETRNGFITRIIGFY